MAYSDQFDLANDRAFQGRIQMCVAEQAQVYVNDGRPEFKYLAQQAIAANEATTAQFVPLVCTRPGVTDASTDLDLLAAVQYLWPMVGVRYVPPEPIESNP